MKTLSEIVSNRSIKFQRINELGHKQFKWKYQDKYYIVLVSIDAGADHVSISHRNKEILPTMEQMLELRRLFFYDDETDVSLYPRSDSLIIQNCWHLFRPYDPSFTKGNYVVAI